MRMLTVVGVLALACVSAGAAMAQSEALGTQRKLKPGEPVKIVLVGDSTTAVGGGWGPGFCPLWKANVACVNEALNGRSTKSFIDEGAWKKSMDDKGTYYLIQFGHNDQKTDPARHTDPQTGFEDNLRRFIAEVQGIGGTPVLVTPLSRRTFKDGKVVEDLNEYADATRAVAREKHVSMIDLNRLSTQLLDTMTQEQADKFDAEAHPDAKAENAARKPPALDRTHLNDYGKQTFGRMVADELVKVQPELAADRVK